MALNKLGIVLLAYVKNYRKKWGIESKKGLTYIFCEIELVAIMYSHRPVVGKPRLAGRMRLCHNLICINK